MTNVFGVAGIFTTCLFPLCFTNKHKAVTLNAQNYEICYEDKDPTTKL